MNNRRILKQTLLMCYLVISGSLIAQDLNRYQMVEIDLSTTDLKSLSKLGIETDHGHHQPHKSFVNFFNQNELQLLDQEQVRYQVIIPDAREHYRQYGTLQHPNITERGGASCDQNSSPSYDYVTPTNYKSGNMGGYLTYSEILENLDLMADLYPDLITEKKQIGNIRTHEGRPLHYLVISNSPDEIDNDKPQVLYNALHHAREPNSISQLLFYMWYLLENYETDPEIKFIVDNTSLFFIPIVNPDGYVFNQRTDPSGGGLWRKNRYVNPMGDTVGVDLNRNYGYFWGHDDSGSSPYEIFETYRGPSPFSEPETQAVRQLCVENNFKIALNYHTFGDLLIHPWGYNDEPTPEDDIYKALGNSIAVENDYFIGTGVETVGYLVNGDSDDWMYGVEDEKNKIYSLTPEVGPSFWPSRENIDQLNKSSLRLNINTALAVHNHGYVEEISIGALTESTGLLSYQYTQSGFLNRPTTIRFVSDTDGLTFSNAVYSDINLNISEKQELMVGYSVDPSFNGDFLSYHIEIDFGAFTQLFPVIKNYTGRRITVVNFTDTISELSNYEATGDWGLSDQVFFSPPFALSDSPNGLYNPNTQSELIILEPFILDDVEAAYLSYYTKFDLERTYDYVQVQVSVDDAPYVDLCGDLTTAANQFEDGRPIYEGSVDWSLETIDLIDYIEADKLQFRFTFSSDQGVQEEGFYVDNITYLSVSAGIVNTQEVRTSALSITPNPARDVVRLSISADIELSAYGYQIFNLLGQPVCQGTIREASLDIDISNVPNGTYYLGVFNGAELVSQSTLIKQE